MATGTPRWCSWLLVLGASASPAADLGDVNGDGRVSYADAFIYRMCIGGEGCPELAPGSTGFDVVFPCTYIQDGGYMGQLLYEESLRRLVPDPLPHFLERWPAPAAPQAEPPAPDGRIVVEVVSTLHAGGEPRVTLDVRVTGFVPIEVLHLAFKVEGLDLAPPLPPTRDPEAAFFTSPEYYLLTHGRLAAFRSNRRPLMNEPSEAIIPFTLELKRGAPAGTYRVDVADAEAVIPGWEVVRPVTISGNLQLADPIDQGNAQPFPPLMFDEGKPRRILGGIEVRTTDAEGFPGDDVSVKVQVRTERPINRLPLTLNCDGVALAIKDVVPLYEDPVSNSVVPEDLGFRFFNRNENLDQDWLWFGFGRGFVQPYDVDRFEPSLVYLVPLGEWIDLVEIRFAILPAAAGKGEVHLNLFHQVEFPMFMPYFTPRKIWADSDCSTDGAMWEYEPTVFHPGRIRILGPGDPPPPPPPPIPPELAGIVFTLGEVEGKPGDVVSVPIALETEVELYQLRLVLGFDASRLDLEGLDASVIDADGNPQELLLTPEDYSFTNAACPGGTLCAPGFPVLGILHGPPHEDVPAATILVDLMTSYIIAVGPGGKPSWEPGVHHKIGAARFRIRDDAEPGVAEVPGVEVSWTQEFHLDPIRSTTSGYPIIEGETPLRSDVPAFEVQAGRVVVTGASFRFIRADSNRDGKVDLSDAVRTLSALFQGGEALACLDAADANDDGRADISDAIYTLGHLFLGGAPPPAPFPEEGTDPTVDTIGC